MDEQETFEGWTRADDWTHADGWLTWDLTPSKGTGTYASPHTECAWRGWQAARSQPTYTNTAQLKD